MASQERTAVPTLPTALTGAQLVIWDFDGVIKESVEVKAQGFVDLFAWAGQAVAQAVAEHHHAHGGMSRLEKIPRYLEMAGEVPTPERIHALSERFGQLVLAKVVEAPWVPGAEAYLRGNPFAQQFALVSATPEPELLGILDALRLREVFCEVHGAPTAKAAAVAQVLEHRGVLPQNAVFVGDARADWEAASICAVPFVLRRHSSNGAVFADYHGPFLTEFST